MIINDGAEDHVYIALFHKVKSTKRSFFLGLMRDVKDNSISLAAILNNSVFMDKEMTELYNEFNDALLYFLSTYD